MAAAPGAPHRGRARDGSGAGPDRGLSSAAPSLRRGPAPGPARRVAAAGPGPALGGHVGKRKLKGCGGRGGLPPPRRLGGRGGLAAGRRSPAGRLTLRGGRRWLPAERDPAGPGAAGRGAGRPAVQGWHQAGAAPLDPAPWKGKPRPSPCFVRSPFSCGADVRTASARRFRGSRGPGARRGRSAVSHGGCASTSSAPAAPSTWSGQPEPAVPPSVPGRRSPALSCQPQIP